MSNPEPAYKVRSRLSELVRIWCDDMTNNERRAYRVKAGRGVSGLDFFLKVGMKN